MASKENKNKLVPKVSLSNISVFGCMNRLHLLRQIRTYSRPILLCFAFLFCFLKWCRDAEAIL
jgi:hypothetical protein